MIEGSQVLEPAEASGEIVVPDQIGAFQWVGAEEQIGL